MKLLSIVTFCFLVILEPANCQKSHRTASAMDARTIAVTIFLVLVFIAFVMNRIWCQNKHDSSERRNMGVNKEEAVISNGTEGRYSATASNFRCEEGPHVYENEVEIECESTAAHRGETNIKVLTTCM